MPTESFPLTLARWPTGRNLGEGEVISDLVIQTNNILEDVIS